MKLYMFQTIPMSIIRNFSLYPQQLYRTEQNSIWFRALLGPMHLGMVYVIQVCRQLSSRIRMELNCLQTCMAYTIAVCTVRNSWWWTEEMSKTC